MKRMIFSAALAVFCLVLCLLFASCDGERITTDDGIDSTTARVEVSSTPDETTAPDESSTPDETTTPDEATSETPSTDTSFDTSFPNTPDPDGTKRY